MAPPRSTVALGAVALVGAGVAVLLGGNGPANGDAAVYAAQLAAGDYTSRPTHTGYLLLARLLGVVLPLPAPRLLDTLSALALALLVWSAGRLARPDQRVAAGVVAVALALPAAPFAEVDLPLAALVGMAAILRSAPGAALASLAACSVSPGALAWLPVLACTRWRRGDGALAPLVGAVGWALLMSPWAVEIAVGPRGVAAAWAEPLPVGRALREGLEALLPAAVSPWALLGALAAPARAAVAGLAFLPAALTLDRVPGVAGQLATVPFVAAVAAEGIAEARRRWPRTGSLAAAVLLALALAGGFRTADVTRWAVRRETETLRALTAAVGPEEQVVAPWGWGQRYAAVAAAGAYVSDTLDPAAGGYWVLPPGTSHACGCRWEPVRLGPSVVWHGVPTEAR